MRIVCPRCQGRFTLPPGTVATWFASAGGRARAACEGHASLTAIGRLGARARWGPDHVRHAHRAVPARRVLDGTSQHDTCRCGATRTRTVTADGTVISRSKWVRKGDA
jgi:hypothetical protein